jgi:hypothetical protein
MNLSQLLEVTCAKPTWMTDRLIRKDPENASKYLNELNETVIKYLGDDDYYNRVKTLSNLISKNKSIKDKFLESVEKNNLFIEVPSFAKIRLRELLRSATPKVNENVVLPLKLVQFMKQKVGAFKDLNINQDIVLPNIFVGPIYVQKLYKIASKLIVARDFGPLKFVTKQPVRGRAMGGGSAFGQMELNLVPINKNNILLQKPRQEKRSYKRHDLINIKYVICYEKALLHLVAIKL